MIVHVESNFILEMVLRQREAGSASFPRRRARKASASFSSTRKKWPGSIRSIRQISPVSFGNLHHSTPAAASQVNGEGGGGMCMTGKKEISSQAPRGLSVRN